MDTIPLSAAILSDQFNNVSGNFILTTSVAAA